MCRWNTPTAATRLATSHVRSITCAGTLLRSKPRSAAWPIGIASRACPTGSAFARRWCWPLRAAPAARSLRTRWPCSRSTWTARLAGNEFAVLRRGADAATAHATALRITQSFEEPLAFEDQTVDLSAGIGIACWPGDADDADTLLSRSEIAMYAAKRRLSGAQQYDASFDSASAQTLSLLTELRHAVEHHELRLYLQPKVPLHGQPGRAAGALGRWPTRAPRAWRCGCRSACPHAICSTRNSAPALPTFWCAMACRPVPSAWRSPKAPSWTTPSAPRPCSTGCRSRASSCRLTTSAPAIPR